MRVEPTDDVRVNGIRVGAQAPKYLMLNKPAGVLTTVDDPQKRTTVMDLVESDVRLFPVGRLDRDTTGLLLMTNDGELAHRMMHPSFGVDKTYQAMVEGSLSNRALQALRDGVELEDGVTSPAEARPLARGNGRTLVELTIHEGRNRQVRRMFDEVGHPVKQLVRVQYGPLSLGALPLGASRPLTGPEIRRLMKVAGMAPPRTHRPSGSAAEKNDERAKRPTGERRQSEPQEPARKPRRRR